MRIFPALVALAAIYLTGCASVSVTGKRAAAPPAHRPTRIAVADFDTRGGEWNITSRSKSRDQFKRETADALADALVRNIETHIGPARRTGSSESISAGEWLVSGRFIRVSEGNPAARIVVGLGAGGTKMETETLVYDSAVRSPFLRFATTGGSNAMPGMIISSGPVGAASNIVQQANRGVRDDAKRTARMITASISEYMAQRGWAKKTSLKAKQPGEFQLLQPQGTPGEASKRRR